MNQRTIWWRRGYCKVGVMIKLIELLTLLQICYYGQVEMKSHTGRAKIKSKSKEPNYSILLSFEQNGRRGKKSSGPCYSAKHIQPLTCI